MSIDDFIKCANYTNGIEYPTRMVRYHPKKFFITAIKYYEDIKNGIIDRPSDYDNTFLDQKINQHAREWLMYEKTILDWIIQGFKPEINENDNFYVKGWNC